MGMECSTDGNYEPHQVIINGPEVECHNLNHPEQIFLQETEATAQQRFSIL